MINVNIRKKNRRKANGECRNEYASMDSNFSQSWRKQYPRNWYLIYFFSLIFFQSHQSDVIFTNACRILGNPVCTLRILFVSTLGGFFHLDLFCRQIVYKFFSESSGTSFLQKDDKRIAASKTEESFFCGNVAGIPRKNFVILIGLPTFYLDSWNYLRKNKYRKDKFHL